MSLMAGSTSTKMFEKLSCEMERTLARPLTLASSSSMGTVMVRSMSSGAAVVASSVVTRIKLVVTSGKRSRCNSLKAA